MEDNKHIPRLLTEADIYEAEHGIISEVMEWAFDEEKDRSAEALNYIFGVYDLANTLALRARGR